MSTKTNMSINIANLTLEELSQSFVSLLFKNGFSQKDVMNLMDTKQHFKIIKLIEKLSQDKKELALKILKEINTKIVSQ